MFMFKSRHFCKSETFSRIAGEEGGKEGSNSEYEALVTWVDQAQALMDAPVNVTDEASLSAHTTMVQVRKFKISLKEVLNLIYFVVLVSMWHLSLI